MSLEEEVLVAVKPTREEVEDVHRAASELLERIEKVAKERGIPAVPLLMGSVAKDTFLKDPEIDIFVAFPETTSREDLQRQGLELGSVLQNPTRKYAEHPYTHGHFNDYEADVVPCYRLDEPSARMTAVDRTPFHLKYVKENLAEERKDEVRLLKQFMKGIGTYGAEAKVQGFSGYLNELLVLKFGSFREVLQAARRWNPPVHIRLETEGKRAFEEPLVFVDPVDGQRNAASAVSLDSLATFIHAATEYLRQPERTFFFPDEPGPPGKEELIKEIEKRGVTVLAITSSAPDLADDILFPQLRKAEQSVVNFLNSGGFRIFRSQHFLMKGRWLILLEMEVHRLPGVRKHIGPHPWMKTASSFTGKWESSSDLFAGPFIEDGRLMVEIRRRQTDASRMLRQDLPTLSLGKHLDEAVQEGFEILQGSEILEKGYREPLAEFLLRGLPWRIRR